MNGEKREAIKAMKTMELFYVLQWQRHEDVSPEYPSLSFVQLQRIICMFANYCQCRKPVLTLQLNVFCQTNLYPKENE